MCLACFYSIWLDVGFFMASLTCPVRPVPNSHTRFLSPSSTGHADYSSSFEDTELVPMDIYPYNKNYKGPRDDLVGESGDSGARHVPPWKHALKSKNIALEELKIPHFDITGDCHS